jgi:spore germination cell wall hydrolase CwlJ-like protein
MTVFSRAATIAALACMISGLLVTSTPGAAAEIDRAIAAPAQIAPFEGENTSVLLPVPVLPVDDATTAAEPRSFTSLDAAVAAQDHAAADQALRCLAGAIYYEAKGEPLAGQLAVAEVVINRAKSGRFPPDVCGVILQRGQFGFVRGGTIPAINEAHAAWKRAVAVAKVALADAWNSPASNALYFNTRASFGSRVVRVAAIGNHIFYR